MKTSFKEIMPVIAIVFVAFIIMSQEIPNTTGNVVSDLNQAKIGNSEYDTNIDNKGNDKLGTTSIEISTSSLTKCCDYNDNGVNKVCYSVGSRSCDYCSHVC